MRYRYVDYNDIFVMDYASYYYYGTENWSFCGESELTSAIDYVVSENLPKVYLLTGHGESSLSDSFTSAVKQQNIETAELSLLTLESVPADADCILINAPQSDISLDEQSKLREYLGNGGNLFLITDPPKNEKLSNLEALMADYGVSTVDGIVVVTSPQDLVSMIVTKAVNMAKMMSIPVLGLVENYSYYQCPDCGAKHAIFGESRLDQVAAHLAHQGLVTDARRFGYLARYKHWENRLQAGRFALNTGWTPDKVLDTLVNGQPVLFRVTVPEGLTWWQTGRLLEDAGLARFEDFRQVIMDPDFLRHYGIPFATAEGFLMPDTYLLKKADVLDLAQARAVAGRMVDNFWRKAAGLWPDGKKPDAATLKTWVILASVVEKETPVEVELPRVSGVYQNRLQKNMLLQADPTVIYGLGPAFDGNLRKSQLDDAANPYNTYQRPGLPPGPICSFGLTALAAAIHPEAHKYLYFVAKTDGGEHVFSTNLNDHNKAVRQYLQNRRKR